MAGKTLINIEKPQTQCIDAVKALLAWRGRAADPLPQFVELGKEKSHLVLVLSNKKDCFYVTTARDCSCPAAIYHRGPCKHRRKYFAEQTIQKQSMAATLEQAEANLHKMPYQYQRMVKAAREAAESEPSDLIPHKPFKPIDPDEIEAAKAASLSSSPVPLVDTLGDTTDLDAAYHSIKVDREMWPMCEA